MPLAKTVRDLEVYQMGLSAAKSVFLLTKRFPADERFSLTDQIRRSSRAVTAMLAEAWGRRRYKASFVNKLDDAMGEANEVQAWLDHARECGYITQAEGVDLDIRYQHIGGKLSRMIDRADDFCKYAPSTDYRTITKDPRAES